jgi:hypothetical protein
MVPHFGNDAVIAGLELMLAKAREGKAGYLFGVLVTDGERPFGGWWGVSTLGNAAIDAVEQVCSAWDQVILNDQLPERDPDAKNHPDRVCYNVPLSPCSFDFIHWLIDAEQKRRIAGAPAPLKIGFWFGRDGNAGLNEPRRKLMFLNVMRPALALIGAVEDPAAVEGEWNRQFGFKGSVDRVKAGHVVPRFKVPADSLETVKKRFPQAPVTITLREDDQWPHRNSNLDAWKKFAVYLISQGESVVFVRDTAKAIEPLDYFRTSPEASFDLHYRAALYEHAKMNLFVSNGPATLAMFSRWAWTMFLKIEPDGHPYMPNTPAFWREEFGMEVGDQFPWARDDQRIVWSDDSYENLVSAWENLYEGARKVA